MLTSRPFPPSSPNLFLYRRTFATTERQAACYTYTAPPSKSRLNRRNYLALELEAKSIWVLSTYSRHVYGNKPPKVFLRSIEASRRFAWQAAAPAAPGFDPAALVQMAFCATRPCCWSRSNQGLAPLARFAFFSRWTMPDKQICLVR